ncbi:response regulator [Motiliproteus coralliicola]|uniref:histidine kinase n=1 Tax=Motiliproteus coralliicola TaxID=2283196 RepID=A0A369WSJ5_9GAMM|nr:NahK/ErcS family hybrid sensor histidine kinase/response regulator [Motiliproteus coralliicola]RDE24143.1 response regulator [Motiliproteus coralliicola]
MRKRSNCPPPPQDGFNPTELERPNTAAERDADGETSHGDEALLQNLIGLGDFSARKSYYPELLGKIDEIEQEKERYEWLFENALHGIFQARIDGPVTAANPAIARICGYASVDEFERIGDIGSQLFAVPQDYLNLLKLLRRHGQRVGFETQLLTADGNRVHISTNVLLKDPERGLIEAFVQDITERKRAQAELSRLNLELEQRVSDRTRELSELNRHLRLEIDERTQIERQLQQAKAEAEAANRSKDKYLAAASHDLLQPLNAARLLVSTLQDREQDAANRQLVERAHIALEGAESLLGDLLDIARLDANAVSAEPSSFCADQLLQQLHTEFEPVARDAGLQLRLVPCRSWIHSDARLLSRILRNFLSNAIRYTDSGAVLLGCRRRSQDTPNDAIEFLVCDTGPGIPADRLDEIYQEFHQLDNATSGQGVGLGLAIVDRIARILDHPIRVQSQPGRGSCFSVQVPLGQACEPQPLDTLAPAIGSGADLQQLSVLVIENEESIQMGMVALLEQWGCRVSCAADQQQALVCLQQQSPAVILADYHLDNELTGLAVLDALYRWCDSQQRPRPAALMITADRSVQLRQLLQQRGLQRLNKPIKPGKLRALISHLLSQ